MTPDGTKPTPNKRYYDAFTWLVTQLVFSFTTAPFILLNIHDSTLVWARVYFYAIIGVTACSLFLVTPGKTYLSKKVKARTGAGRPASLRRNESQESLYVHFRRGPSFFEASTDHSAIIGMALRWGSQPLLVTPSTRWLTKLSRRSRRDEVLRLDRRVVNCGRR